MFEVAKTSNASSSRLTFNSAHRPLPRTPQSSGDNHPHTRTVCGSRTWKIISLISPDQRSAKPGGHVEYSPVFSCLLLLPPPRTRAGREDLLLLTLLLPQSAIINESHPNFCLSGREIEFRNGPATPQQYSIKEKTRGKWRQTKGINAKNRLSFLRGARWQCKNNDKYGRRSLPSN